MTMIALFFGESLFRFPAFLFLFYFPGMYTGDYMSSNHQNAEPYVARAMVFTAQFLYFFAVAVAARVAYRLSKNRMSITCVMIQRVLH